jgi:hypothetical protein
MNLAVYSSLEAFVSHYEALRATARRADGASALSARERDLLTVMEQMLDGLDPDARSALATVTSAPQPAAGSVARRRARAERSLRRVLAARGVLQG